MDKEDFRPTKLSPTIVKKQLAELKLRPNKKQGQCFLIDENLANKSLRLACVQAQDKIVEIGPGLGALTAKLLATGAEVHAIEKDARLYRHLQTHLASPRLHLQKGDAVKTPLAGIKESAKCKVVANLPYAISLPWLEALLKGKLPQELILMLQKETADRLTATTGKAYGPISIALSGTYQLASKHPVAPSCFHPIPKVRSVLTHWKQKTQKIRYTTPCYRLIRHLFTQRRKQIGKLLTTAAPHATGWLQDLQHAQLPATTRPPAIPASLYAKLITYFPES